MCQLLFHGKITVSNEVCRCCIPLYINAEPGSLPLSAQLCPALDVYMLPTNCCVLTHSYNSAPPMSKLRRVKGFVPLAALDKISVYGYTRRIGRYLLHKFCSFGYGKRTIRLPVSVISLVILCKGLSCKCFI